MQNAQWHDPSPMLNEDDTSDVPRIKSPEEVIDQYGVRAALLVLCIALFVAAVWVASAPSFGKCSVLQDPNERHACYDSLRSELLKPPAKGADIVVR